jgi:hypothetical protein
MGIDPETLRLVAQYLDHYATAGPINQKVAYKKEETGIRGCKM